MKKILLISLFSGFAAFSATASAANDMDTMPQGQARAHPSAPPSKAGIEVRIGAYPKGNITPLPDAVKNFHGNNRSSDDRKGTPE